MKRHSQSLVVMLVLAVVMLAFPVAVDAAAGVSVAPQAGAPGTQFVVTGAGLTANGLYSLLITRGMAAGQTFDVTADAKGLVRFTLDSTGYAEDTDYRATITPKIGGNTLSTTRFAVQATQPERCFAETGFCLRGRFLAYWDTHGGLSINGFPLSEEFSEVLEDGQPYVVQYFERTRLEYHPEATDAQFEVLLGQFGRRIRPAEAAGMPNPMMVWFPETQHNVPNDFYGYWSAHGGLTQFGYPIGEPFMQVLDGKAYQVQYFERARLEAHPENPPPYDILLGQFGRIVLGQVVR